MFCFCVKMEAAKLYKRDFGFSIKSGGKNVKKIPIKIVLNFNSSHFHGFITQYLMQSFNDLWPRVSHLCFTLWLCDRHLKCNKNSILYLTSRGRSYTVVALQLNITALAVIIQFSVTLTDYLLYRFQCPLSKKYLVKQWLKRTGI